MEIQASLTLILFHTLRHVYCLNDIFGTDLDKETDAILQCLQSNFNLMNALGKQA